MPHLPQECLVREGEHSKRTLSLSKTPCLLVYYFVPTNSVHTIISFPHVLLYLKRNDDLVAIRNDIK